MGTFIKDSWILLVLVASSIVVYTPWIVIKRKDLNLAVWECIIVCVTGAIFGTLGAILFAKLEVGFDLSRAVNFRIFGTPFFEIFFFWFVLKIKKAPLRYGMDIYALTMPLVLIFGRLNCIISGCCEGVYIGYTEYKWPIREIEIGAEVLFLAIFVPLVALKKTNGIVYPIYMITYGAVRFFCEFFRYEYLPPEGRWHLAHTWALFFMIIGVVWLLFLKYNLVDYFKKYLNERK